MILSALLSAAAALATPPPAVFAVVVAHNQSFDGSLAPLRYADDDGARYAELLGLAAERVELLSVMDAETQARHPALARAARVPRRKELLATLARTFSAMEAANAAGRRTVFYFVYVGHGSVGEDGEGAVHLVDGRFSRADLYQEVLARSPATINHVVVDACHAYLMVARRGEGEKIEEALESFLQKESLERYPNTGVVLSTSQAKEVHEWSRFSAGIFSHELRSALAGGADVNGDGEVDYAETRAFIAAANARVENPAARLDVFVRPPAVHTREPLFSRAWADEAPTLKVPPERAGRWFVEDDRGVRYADFHSAADTALELTLVPRPLYFLRDGLGHELEVSLAVARTVDAGALELHDRTLAHRGSEAVTFQRDLFALPFGRAYFEGYRAAAPRPRPGVTMREERAEGGLDGRDWAAIVTGAAGVAAAATGAGFALAAEDKAALYRGFVGDTDELEELREASQTDTTVSRVLLGVGGGLITAAVALALWPD